MTRKHALFTMHTSENEVVKAAVGEAVEMRREVRVSLELNTVQFLSHDIHTRVDHVSVIALH